MHAGNHQCRIFDRLDSTDRLQALVLRYGKDSYSDEKEVSKILPFCLLPYLRERLVAVGASADARRLILANSARMLGYGMLDVMMALYLSELGFDPLRIGFLLTATLMGSTLLNFAVVALSARSSRRAAYVVAHLAFLIASPSGTINFTSPITSGFVALDQSIIPDVTSVRSRNAVYGTYNSLALLARMAGALLSRAIGLELIAGYRLLLGFFVMLALVSLMFVLRLSLRSEGDDYGARLRQATPFRLERSGPIVRRLSMLFSIDALASGFIAQSMIVLWFNLQFGVGAEVLGPAYSAIRLLQASAYPLAMLIAGRVGLLNTMVFTHLPSQLMLIALPLMPSLPLALGLLFAQQMLSNMDIPTRQAYIASVVRPEERTAAAGITNMTRNFAQGISPSISGFAFRSRAYGLPFVLSALVGAAYDLALFFSFRSLEPSEEAATHASTNI